MDTLRRHRRATSVDVLQQSFAEIVKAKRRLGTYLPEGVIRQENTAGLTLVLDTRRDVDAVAEDVVAVDDDVAHVDADTETEIGGAGRYCRLHRHRACHRIDRARELHKHAVASGLDDATLVFGDGGIDELAPQRL